MMKTTETLGQLSDAIKNKCQLASEVLLAKHIEEREHERFGDFFCGFMTCIFLVVCVMGFNYAIG